MIDPNGRLTRENKNRVVHHIVDAEGFRLHMHLDTATNPVVTVGLGYAMFNVS